MIEAMKAQQLHREILAGEQLGFPSAESYAVARTVPVLAKLLRRYPRAADADETIERCYEAALKELHIAQLERELKLAGTREDRRRIARLIDELRGER